MAIKDLQARMGNVELVFTVVEKGDVREFEKFGKTGRVCNAVVKDDSGRISLTLWNEDVDKVGIGDKVQITNGWVGEYQGELQLSTGKFGTLKVLERGTVGDKVAEPQASVHDHDAHGPGNGGNPSAGDESSLSEDPITDEETVE